jgi:hypothetical protein
MTVTNLANNDTYSAPFYDFLGSDSLYVGDDQGSLEKFTGVFSGASTAPATVALGHGNPLASPVLDGNSGCVFVGDTAGYLYSVDSGLPGGTECSSGTFSTHATSTILGSGPNTGIFDGVLVDPSAGEVYAFVAASAALGNCSVNSNCVVQYPVSLSGGASPASAQSVGTGGTSYPLYSGTFDNVYYSSPTPDGNLYIIGNTGVTTGATLYQVPITSGAMGTPVGAVTNLTRNGAYPWPSPLTEFCNDGASANPCPVSGGITTSGSDYLFFSLNSATPSGCTATAGNGCVLSYRINTTTPAQSGSGLNVPTPGTNGCWASSSIVIDNADTGTPGAQQIYFFGQNSAAAGGPNGQTSANCTAGKPLTVRAVQASQANP